MTRQRPQTRDVLTHQCSIRASCSSDQCEWSLSFHGAAYRNGVCTVWPFPKVAVEEKLGFSSLLVFHTQPSVVTTEECMFPSLFVFARVPEEHQLPCIKFISPPLKSS